MVACAREFRWKVDKLKEGRSEAAFSETRTRGVDGFEGRLGTRDLVT